MIIASSKRRDRGFGAGELLAGIAAAQLAGDDFLTGLDRQRADAAGQQITPVPGLASTTAAGLARRITPARWQAVEHGLAVVTSRMLSLLPAERAAALTDGPVTIDLDTTDVEVYGRKERGAYNYQGQRVGRPHVAAWAEAEIVLAADLGAAGEPRLAAMIADPGQYDIGAATARFGDLMKRVHDPAADQEFNALLTIPAVKALLAPRMVTHGLSSVRAYCADLLRYTNADTVTRVTCPSYCRRPGSAGARAGDTRESSTAGSCSSRSSADPRHGLDRRCKNPGWAQIR